MSEMTTTEAAALVEADKKRRVQVAAEAVQAALAEHGCGMQAQIIVTADGRLDAQILIVPR